MRFPVEGAFDCSRPFAGWPASALPAFAQIPFGLLSGATRGCTLFRRRQRNTCAPGFRQPDGNGLFGRSGAVFALTNVLHFFTDKFTRLCGSRLTFSRVPARTFNCLFFRHTSDLSNIEPGSGCIRSISIW
jgi:hypothetical protein